MEVIKFTILNGIHHKIPVYGNYCTYLFSAKLSYDDYLPNLVDAEKLLDDNLDNRLPCGTQRNLAIDGEPYLHG
jgi:hypothetical protein